MYQPRPPVQENKVRKLVLQYGLPGLLLLSIVRHFAPRDVSVEEKNEEVRSRRKYFASFLFALKSSTLRNMLLSALGVTYLSNKFFGVRAKRAFPSFFCYNLGTDLLLQGYRNPAGLVSTHVLQHYACREEQDDHYGVLACVLALQPPCSNCHVLCALGS
mmetsp:Transcript_4383/g.9468  ORF Transcript_4383/g.9468 Transcript_4383/m.9468 type:complete len:160 (-) Transcript_4383:1639-2118(-)